MAETGDEMGEIGSGARKGKVNMSGSMMKKEKISSYCNISDEITSDSKITVNLENIVVKFDFNKFFFRTS